MADPGLRFGTDSQLLFFPEKEIFPVIGTNLV